MGLLNSNGHYDRELGRADVAAGCGELPRQQELRSRDTEIQSLLNLIKASADLDSITAASIPVSRGEEAVGYWMPSQIDHVAQPAEALEFSLILKVSDFRTVASASVMLTSDEESQVNICFNASQETDAAAIEYSLKSLNSWIRLHLDRLKVMVVASQNDELSRRILSGIVEAPGAEDKILTAGPMIGPREVSYAISATRYGWNANHSDYLKRFEQDFAEYVGAEYAIATSSCTGALHLAMLAAGIGAGDEVIVPETTWVATASAVAYTGAQPIFADVDPQTWTLSPESVEQLITSRTKAIVPVHLYGYAADMNSLMTVARQANLRVIEDAAPAIGTLTGESPVGSIGDMGCFSFQGAKMLVTGEGGMLVTNDKDLHERAWKQQDHGRVPGTFWIDTLGRKYKMSNLTAALGLAQLQSVETQIAKKRRINTWYRELLAPVPYLTFQEEVSDSRSICWMTSISVSPESGITASTLASQLREQGIDTRPVFPPISGYPIWGRQAAPNPPGVNASAIGSTSLNLPSGVTLSRASVERVASAIAEALT